MKPIPIGTSDAGDVSIDVGKLLVSKAFICANSGGGKSFLIRKIAEGAIPLVQTIILDPEGEYSTLREKFDLLIVGAGGEVPADPRTAGTLAVKIAGMGIGAVIDLSDLKLPARRSFVRIFCESIIELPRAMWHSKLIVIDEAHMFVPEKGNDEAESGKAVIDVLVRGRKRGIGATLASQRFSKVHKDAEAECNTIFVGRTSQDLDQQRAAKLLGITPKEAVGLRDLTPGNFHAYGPALIGFNGVSLLKVGQVITTHPTPGSKHVSSPPKASDAVKKLVAELADIPKLAEEEARTLADAKRQIGELQRQLKARPKEMVEKSVEKRVEVPIFKDGHVKRMEAAAAKLVQVGMTAGTVGKEITDLLARAQAVKAPVAKPQSFIPNGDPRPISNAAPKTYKPSSTGVNASLPEGEKKVLTVIAQYPDGAAREQITVLTGYKRSSRDTYIQRLRGRGFVDVAGEKMIPTQAGIDALGESFQPLPTGEELQRYWLDEQTGRLPEGERKILAILVAEYPSAVARDAISEATQYQRSSRDTYLQRLSSRQLITTSRDGARASDNLF